MEAKYISPKTAAVEQELFNLFKGKIALKITGKSDKLGLITFERKDPNDGKENGELSVDSQGCLRGKIWHRTDSMAVSIAESPQSHFYVDFINDRDNKKSYVRLIRWAYIKQPLTLQANLFDNSCIAVASYDTYGFEHFYFGLPKDLCASYANNGTELLSLITYGKDNPKQYSYVCHPNNRIEFNKYDKATGKNTTTSVPAKLYNFSEIVKAAHKRTNWRDIMFNNSYQPPWLLIPKLINIQLTQSQHK